jgi:hypothetical protein
VGFLETLDPATEWEAQKTLLRQTAPRRPVADVPGEADAEEPTLVGIH